MEVKLMESTIKCHYKSDGGRSRIAPVDLLTLKPEAGKNQMEPDPPNSFSLAVSTAAHPNVTWIFSQAGEVLYPGSMDALLHRMRKHNLLAQRKVAELTATEYAKWPDRIPGGIPPLVFTEARYYLRVALPGQAKLLLAGHLVDSLSQPARTHAEIKLLLSEGQCELAIETGKGNLLALMASLNFGKVVSGLYDQTVTRVYPGSLNLEDTLARQATYANDHSPSLITLVNEDEEIMYVHGFDEEAIAALITKLGFPVEEWFFKDMIWLLREAFKER